MHRSIPALFALVLTACGTTDTPAGDTGDTGADEVATARGSCSYLNTFSDGPECKEYVGEAWTEDAMQGDCAAPFIGADPGTLTLDANCNYESTLGRCILDAEADTRVELVFPGDDPGACAGVELGCGFGDGTFVPSDICEGGGGGPTSGLGTFQPFSETCVEPLDGEPAGASDGDVCTWNAISACTEEGRKYEDYGACDDVLTQRPYAAVDARDPGTTADDPRLDDADWVNEFDWVTEQVEACACVCCHSTELAPDGPSDWYLEAEPIWIDTLGDAGLAMLAGWVDSTAFGAFPPGENNGFDRETTGLPTTDVARMVAFLEGELTRRGLAEDDFTETEPFGGPLYDQLFYEPAACGAGQGIDAAGQLSWTGGDARYVYVLETGSMAPGVPPNLDIPEGTLWRLDVAPDDDPLEDGSVTYGTAPLGATQAFPEAAAPKALTSGETYYLYVLRDVYQPITRCLTTIP